jgi:hypothetical protein
MDQRLFLARFERERGCAFGAGGGASAADLPLDLPLALRAAGLRPFGLDLPFDPAPVFGVASSFASFALGATVPLVAAVPSVAPERLACFGAGFGGGLSSLPSLAEPISRSTATGSTIPDRNITSCVPIRIAEDTTM